MSWVKGQSFGTKGYPKPEYGRNYVAMSDDGNVIAVTGKDAVTIANFGDSGLKLDYIPIHKYAGLNEIDNGYSGNTVSLSGDGKRILIGSKCLKGMKNLNGGHKSQLLEYSKADGWTVTSTWSRVIKSDYSCSSAKLSSDGKTVAISTFNPYLPPDLEKWNGQTEVIFLADHHMYQLGSRIGHGGRSASLSSDGKQFAVSSISHTELYQSNGTVFYSVITDSIDSSMSFDCNFESVATAKYKKVKSPNGDHTTHLIWRLRVYSTSKQPASWDTVYQNASVDLSANINITDKTMPVVSMSCKDSTFAVIDPHFKFGGIIRSSDLKKRFDFPNEWRIVAVAMNDNGNKFALSYKLKGGSSNKPLTVTDIYEWIKPQDLSNQSIQLKEPQNSVSSILPIFAIISIAFWFFVRRR